MASILLKNGRVVNVGSKKIEERDVFVRDGYFTACPEGVVPDEMIDLKGAYLAPGLVDGHIHIESSMLSPLDFSAEAVKWGTTSVFADPHEIANVLGRKGVELFLEQADLVPYSMYIGVPSCVPATGMETSGGVIDLEDVKELLRDDRVYGLAEMMNFPGIIYGIGDARAKVRAAEETGKVIDGHCPGLTGDDLLIYISNGGPDWKIRIGSDHESTTPEEAIEKWEKGMYVMLRHGSASKDLENILPEVCRRELDLDRFGLVSDDLSAVDLRSGGHMNRLVNIAAGIIREQTGKGPEEAAVEAISMATINHGRYFHKDIGSIADGKQADLIVFDSVEDIRPHTVIAKGKVVVRGGTYTGERIEYDYSGYAHPVTVPHGLAEKLLVNSGKETEKVRVIGVREGSLLTESLTVEMPVSGGLVHPGPDSGIAKVAVIERHKGTEKMSLGFVKGFDFDRGAIASTVAHDSHNLVVMGKSETEMMKAIESVRHIGGGLAAVSGQKSELLPLELGGLMSTEGIDAVLARHEALEKLIREMGFERDPFPTLSFIALPVIPNLKITDSGLVDVNNFDYVDLLVK